MASRDAEWWQDCADVVELFRKAPTAQKDKAARAVREFLVHHNAHEVIDEASLVDLEAVGTGAQLEAWLAPHDLPRPRPWGSRVIDLPTLLAEYDEE